MLTGLDRLGDMQLSLYNGLVYGVCGQRDTPGKEATLYYIIVPGQ